MVVITVRHQAHSKLTPAPRPQWSLKLPIKHYRTNLNSAQVKNTPQSLSGVEATMGHFLAKVCQVWNCWMIYFPKLAKSTMFSSLDAKNVFWQIPLEENSPCLTTFITPLDGYCFKRLPSGIISALEVFNKRCLHGHDGMVVDMDHRKFMTRDIKRSWRPRASGLRLNKDKCQLNQTELNFLGKVVTKDGIAPSPVCEGHYNKWNHPKMLAKWDVWNG